MKKNTNLKFALMVFTVVVCVMSFVFETSAQKRRRTTRRATKPAATASATSSANAAELKDGAQKISTQIKNVSKFLYLLGGIAKNIEAIDADVKARRITRQTTIDQNEKAKQAVVLSIRNLRAGLAALETDFRTKNALRIYAPWSDGISGITQQAEEQASSGQLTEAGNTLLLVVEKLSDTLAALP